MLNHELNLIMGLLYIVHYKLNLITSLLHHELEFYLNLGVEDRARSGWLPGSPIVEMCIMM